MQTNNTVGIVAVLDPLELYKDQTPPTEAHIWAKEMAWGNMKEDIRSLPTPPPMIVSQQVDNYAVTTQVPTSAAPHLLKRSGIIPGLEIRPWLTNEEPPAEVASKIIWLKVPDMTPKHSNEMAKTKYTKLVCRPNIWKWKWPIGHSPMGIRPYHRNAAI